MDSDELQSTIFAKISTLEPEYASKIIGYLLSLDIDIRDLIRLALGPDNLLQSFCQKAKSDLGISSRILSLNPNSTPIHRQPLYQSSSNNEFLEFSRNPNVFASSSGDFVGEQQQLSWYTPLKNEDPFANGHKSSLSANDNRFGGPGYRFPQTGLVDERDQEQKRMLLAQQQRNAAANDFNILLQTQNAQRQGSGAGYRFPQAGLVDERDNICLQKAEMMRMKSAQHYREGSGQFGFLTTCRQGSGQFGEEFGYSSCHENEETDRRKIFLTFPAESSFSKFDVKYYFRKFGFVEAVKIPFQRKRTFGFVTFANSEPVRIVMAHGNPHFISGSPVFVYKKIERSYQIQGSEHFGDEVHDQLLSESSSSRNPNIERGPRMFSNNTHEMLRIKDELEPPQRRIFPETEIDFIHHHMHRLSIDSPAYFTPQEESGPRMFSNNRLEMIRRKAKLEEVERPQRKRQENTLPDSLYSSPEQHKADSSDKSS